MQEVGVETILGMQNRSTRPRRTVGDSCDVPCASIASLTHLPNFMIAERASCQSALSQAVSASGSGRVLAQRASFQL